MISLCFAFFLHYFSFVFSMAAMHQHRRGSSVSSSASLEDGELINNDDEIKNDPRVSPQSGRTNANLWRDIAMEQNLEEQLRMGPLISERHLTVRGTETYEIPDYDNMDQDEMVKRQQMINESLRKVVSADNSEDIFNPTEDIDNEYGTGSRRFRKRHVPSDRIPIASKDAERLKQENASWKRPKYNADNRLKVKKEADGDKHEPSSTSTPPPSNPASTSGSRQSLNKKKKKFGSKTSVNSNASDESKRSTTRPNNAHLPMPVSLLKEGYSLEKLLHTELDEDLDDEEFGLLIADALGELRPEMISYSVKVLGRETSIRLFKKTQEIENSGGMHVDNQSRRRTPGGVFIKLLRSDKIIPYELRNDVRDFCQKLYRLQQEMQKKEEASLPALPKASDVIKPVLENDTLME